MILSWRKEPDLRRVLLIAGGFFVLVTGLLLHRYFTYYASFDQGIFNQVFWNNAHGNLFQSTLSSQLSTNVVHSGELPQTTYRRLGQHFTPALLLWWPIYTVFPSPATLSVLQAAFATLSGLLLYALARKYLEQRLSLAIMVSFYGAIAVLNPYLANFHDIGQIPLFIFGLLLAMEYRRWWIFALLCLVILAVREDSPVALFGIGAYLVASRRHPRIGLGVCALSVGYFVLVTNVFMPAFSEDISKRFMIEEFGQYINDDEASTLDVLWAMISQPGLLLRELVSPPGDTLEYFAGHWLPLAFIPALSPAAWIIAGPPLLKLTLTEGSSGLNTSIRYALNVVPGMFYGTILWWAGQGFRRFMQPWETVRSRSPSRNFRRFWSVCLIISLVFIPISNPSRVFTVLIPDSIQPWVYVSPILQWQRAQAMNRLLAQIPADASVTATTYLVPHVSGRRAILRMPLIAYQDDAGTARDVDYIAADLWRLQRYQVAFSRDRDRLHHFTQLINAWIATEQYGLIQAKDGLILLQRDSPSAPQALEDWQTFLSPDE
ncbi:DUF2079 domain-containing protein [Oscillatoria sp. CS-180]|uniref:DUF2079 domain-containing protein n=1 Tax=Oscillatoria sp. CS-180 TaxID=3021720 RepID=UPI00232C374E|nr:DUF2079 domain-containing protein [Oscillatoria sp. CS-180]MDB9529418.1 DUF2079 domain-containing protein [Oscillatoria sp. CS-180]